jgi:hypothetical protein
MTIQGISEQLDLAAWEHETRGPAGQWISRDYEGVTGNPQHITRTEQGLIPTSAIASLHGAEGEVPGEHRNKLGPAWESFKRSISENGITDPVFITVDHGQEPKISEGSHRRDAAVSLGLSHVPVEIRYFGHAEHQGTVLQRARQVQTSNTVTGQLDLAAWEHEARGAHGEWIRGGALSPVYNDIPETQGISRGKSTYEEGGGTGRSRADEERLATWKRAHSGSYEIPDPSRWFNQRSPYKNAADHPFFRAHPVSPAHVMAAWDHATPEQREQGMRWYADAHLVAQALAKTYLNGDTAKAAGIISALSPKTGWGTNLINAARIAATGNALSFKGQATGDMKAAAQRALDGVPIDKAFPSPKTNSFAHLIAEGGDRQGDKLGEVVIDRHALDVATGEAINDREGGKAPIDDTRFHEYVADQYRLAAKAISERQGHPVAPHQVQAVTWLVRQAEAEAADRAAAESGQMTPQESRLFRGRVTRTRNAWRNWADYAQRHNIPVEPGTTFRAEPITAAEARGNSRPVSDAEFQALAAEGLRELQRLSQDKAPVTGLDRNWPAVKENAWAEVQKSWGGATISAQTGQPLPQGADRYALTVRPAGMADVSVPETASKDEFYAAMDRALAEYRSQLELGQRYLGVFHDDDLHRIDIDPVLVVDTTHEVETIGAFTHAIGGAYHFKSGDGYWPPHVAAAELSWGSGRDLASGTALPAGTSQGSPLISLQLSTPDLPPRPPTTISSQVLDLSWKDAWKTERRDARGRWTSGAGLYLKPEEAEHARNATLLSGFRTDISAILKREGNKPEPNPGVTRNLRTANAQLWMGDIEQTLGVLREAWQAAHDAGDKDTAHFIAKVGNNIESTTAERAAQEKAVKDYADKGAAVLPDILGGGQESWNGKVEVFPHDTEPGVAGELRWNGDMRIDSATAAHLKTMFEMHNEPVQDPRAPQVVLHELIHGLIGSGSYDGGADAYQHQDIGAIEEGFTELGSIQHAAEFFNQTGIGDRATNIISATSGGHIIEKPDTPTLRALGDGLRSLREMLGTEGGYPGSMEAYNAATDAQYSFYAERFDTQVIAASLSKVKHYTHNAPAAALAQSLLERLDAADVKIGHATMAEYADRLNDPGRIYDGDAWGAYGWQTAAALQWIQQVADAEGFSDRSKGTPGWQRLIELADEINREGADGKMTIMARQAVRAAGGDVNNPELVRLARSGIELSNWFRPGDTNIGRLAFGRASKQITMKLAQDRAA